MKKIISMILAVMLIATVSVALIVSAGAEEASNVTEWIAWKMDGKELVLGTVTLNNDGFVKNLSSNYEIKAQDTQAKITESYKSPATVWTKDAAQDFVFAWEVVGGSKVEVGFLHSVGAVVDGLFVVDRDGNKLHDLCKLQWSADGDNWTDAVVDIDPQESVLVSGMTGFTADEVKPQVGNGTDAYSEDYFVISGTVGETAKYVRFVYAATTRSNTWDPCLRDAVFTAPVSDVSSEEPSSVEESSAAASSSAETSGTTNTGSAGYTAVAIIAIITLAGAVAVKKAR